MALLERDGELARIDELITDSDERHGHLVAVVGPAGCGKTRLLGEIAERAAASDMAILSARGAELERELPFGIARQLFEILLARAPDAERQALLEGAAGLASGALELRPGGDGQSAEAPFSALHGLYWLAANIATRRPLALIVDDLHWADDPSLRWLSYLAVRLEGMPLLIAVATRSATAGAGELVQTLLDTPGAETLRPAPLSPAAVAGFVCDQLGRPVDPEFSAACYEVTRGNPFLLGELLRAAVSSGLRGESREAPRIHELHPEGVSRAVLGRLRDLPDGAIDVANAVATLGGAAGLRHAATLAGIALDRAALLVDALTRADVISPGRPLEFVHPLVRQAIQAERSPAARAVAHRHAATVLSEAGAEPETVATQLLQTEPGAEEWAVETLRAAGRSALARGAPDAAVTYFQRAMSEPPNADLRQTMLRELASAELHAGGLAHRPGGPEPKAVAHLREALELSSDPIERGDTALELGDALWAASEPEGAVRVFDEAREGLSAEPRLAMLLESHALGACLFASGSPDALTDRLARIRAPEGSTPEERLLTGVLAYQRAFAAAPAAEVVELAERALGDGEGLGEAATPWSLNFAPVALVFAESLDRADPVLARILADATERGAIRILAIVRCWRSRIAYLRGSIPNAEADARAALELAAARGWGRNVPTTHAFLIDALLESGDLDEAEKTLAASGLEDGAPGPLPWTWLLSRRARIHMERGRLPEALDDLLECGRRAEQVTLRNPAVLSWRGAAALASLALGDETQARRLAGEEVELARGAETPGALGTAMRTAGLVEGGEHGIALLEHAVSVLETSPFRLELARALADLGAALRRANRRVDARAPLRRAIDLAHGGGAKALVRRAHQELIATGARPRRLMLTGLDALTATERRVADLAAQGMSNREIAQALFVTVRTIEVHLSSAYRKLDIGSRNELPAALGARKR